MAGDASARRRRPAARQGVDAQEHGSELTYRRATAGFPRRSDGGGRGGAAIALRAGRLVPSPARRTLQTRARLMTGRAPEPRKRPGASAAEVARGARLPEEQRAFRTSRIGDVLADALPAEAWTRLGAVRHGQKRMPVAPRGAELWYRADQVAPHDPDPPPSLRSVVLQDGDMAGCRRGRR